MLFYSLTHIQLTAWKLLGILFDILSIRLLLVFDGGKHTKMLKRADGTQTTQVFATVYPHRDRLLNMHFP